LCASTRQPWTASAKAQRIFMHGERLGHSRSISRGI
jgi:hypothetical protein